MSQVFSHAALAVEPFLTNPMIPDGVSSHVFRISVHDGVFGHVFKTPVSDSVSSQKGGSLSQVFSHAALAVEPFLTNPIIEGEACLKYSAMQPSCRGAFVTNPVASLSQVLSHAALMP